MVAAYKDAGDPKQIFGSGFHIGGTKYMTVKAEDRSVYGKKVSQCPSHASSPNAKSTAML